MNHTNYKPAKPGLIAERIAKAKEYAIERTMFNKDSKAVVMTAMYGSRKTPAHRAIAARFGDIGQIMQASSLKYSDRGDFTACYRGGF